MTIDEIKSVSIISWLEANNYGPGKKKGTTIWYYSPFRKETTPSFHVDPNLNLWFDFKEGTGGNLINLVQKINPGWSNHQVLMTLESQIQSQHLEYAVDYAGQRDQKNAKEEFIRMRQEERNNATVINYTTDLTHPYLRDYILERRIDYDVAQRFCKEVHYTANGKQYYAIAFQNIEGGMEARNKFCKRCIGKKTISKVIPYEKPQRHCCVFEGFFDMLTYATIERWMDIGISVGLPCDFFVLNSTSCVKTLLPYLKDYETIHCFLDNDDAGRKAYGQIAKAYPVTANDESYRYSGYKDLNDVLNGNPIRQQS